MKISRILVLFLAAALFSCQTSALAAGDQGWLTPVVREAPAFTDTAGTIAESAAGVCFRAGVMSGVDGKHFMPYSGLSNAQIIVISGRLHRLLETGGLGDFDSYRLPKDQWWMPYDKYLREQIPALGENDGYLDMVKYPDSPCGRMNFFRTLAAALKDAGTVLPEINRVDAVPDCQDQDVIAFYRAGILGGKDQYGTLDADGALTRGAAAAMLARIIDPSLRLSLSLETMDLCRILLDTEPETVVASVNGRDVTAEMFVGSFAETVAYYERNHFAAMNQTESEALETLRSIARWAQVEDLAAELGLELPQNQEAFFDGYLGLTANGQRWRARWTALDAAVREALGTETLPDLQEDIQFAGGWSEERLQKNWFRVYSLPGWKLPS